VLNQRHASERHIASVRNRKCQSTPRERHDGFELEQGDAGIAAPRGDAMFVPVFAVRATSPAYLVAHESVEYLVKLCRKFEQRGRDRADSFNGPFAIRII